MSLTFPPPLPRLVHKAGAAAFLIFACASASASDQAQEYVQARNIALKDERVQDAFQRANEKLDDRIVEIDPSLKSYAGKHKSHFGLVPASVATAKPPPASAAQKPVPDGEVTHVVAKGKTLSSIALQYKVSVASLKAANHIEDERKLRVGQKLAIPQAKSGAEKTKDEPGFWDRLRDDF